MSLGTRLQERRKYLDITQEVLANNLNVPRELISMWEHDRRVPNIGQLKEIALLLNLSTNYLLGKEDIKAGNLQPIFSNLQPIFRAVKNPASQKELNRWFKFLNDWAEFLEEDLEEKITKPKIYKGFEDYHGTTDARRAPKLANKVREHFQLGLDAIPDLYAFFNENQILVYRYPLGSPGDKNDGISGAFVNHPKLGACVLVNASVSRGRQMFTLAHELAHAIFHHSTDLHVSKFSGRSQKMERFANVFAANFLVPAKPLRELAGKDPDPYEVIDLASYFKVSYWSMLIRLKEENIITPKIFEEYREYSPNDMATRLGQPSQLFNANTFIESVYVSPYPTSVIQKTKAAIDDDLLSPSQAADLLNLDTATIRAVILNDFDEPTSDEKKARDEEEYGIATR